MSNFTDIITKSRYLVLGLSLLVTSPSVFAQGDATPPAAAAPTAVVTDPQAKALLDQSVAHYRKLTTLSVMYERGGRTQLIQFRAPQSLKVSYLDAKGNVSAVQTFTDTELITLQKPNDTYEWTATPRTIAPAGQDPRGKLALTTVGGMFFPSFLAGLEPFGEGGRYKASSYTLGAPTTTDGVAVTPVIVTIEKTDKQTFDITTTFLVGNEDHLVHSIQTEVKFPNGQVSKTFESFKSIQPDSDLPEATFTFAPPEGATKVEKFSQPQIRATVGQAPIAINTKDILDKDISFDQFKGKVVLVDFWATWCGPCVAELPNVKAAYGKYHDQGFDVVGISLDQSTEPLTKFIKEKEMPWRQVFDGYWDGPIATGYNVRAIPATLLIGKDGKIAAVGARGPALEPAIQAALAAP
ncbi:thiol-disulfide oxidoreductase ResA [Abditibacteriota bacterium]|nr:thiol-disulfide oxidoreductase ResA [Abditibacteriota bacterium]